MERLAGQYMHVTPQQREGGQHHIKTRHAVKVICAFGALQGQDAQGRGHARRFGLPVENQRGGQHHQGRNVQPPGLLFDQQMGQRLRRFSQPHVVCQNSGQVVLAQVLQPSHTLQLVRSQS